MSEGRHIDFASECGHAPLFIKPEMAPQAIEHKLFCLAKRALLVVDASGANAIQAAALDTIIVEELEKQIVSLRAFFESCQSQSGHFITPEQVRRYAA